MCVCVCVCVGGGVMGDSWEIYVGGMGISWGRYVEGIDEVTREEGMRDGMMGICVRNVFGMVWWGNS